MDDKKKIIFFDGVCNLCNSSVDFVIKRDPHHQFYFASLQSETAKKLLSKSEYAQMNSIIYYESSRKYYKSSAALKIAMSLNGPWPILALFLIVPGFIRNPFYDFIASNRYKWFGKSDTCRLPGQDELKYFLP